MLSLFYAWLKNPPVSIEMDVGQALYLAGRPYNLAECLGGEKNFFPIRNQTPDWPAHNLVSILIMLSWILPVEYGKAVFECQYVKERYIWDSK
jgi:hypothetical protein